MNSETGDDNKEEHTAIPIIQLHGYEAYANNKIEKSDAGFSKSTDDTDADNTDPTTEPYNEIDNTVWIML